MENRKIITHERELPTPCYVFDTDLFRERIRTIEKNLEGRAEICYAMKANPFLIEAVEGRKIEVCSPGEFAICERAGIRPEQVVLSGVNKEEQEIRRVMERYGAAMVYTVESEGQYSLLSRTARELGIRIGVLLRLTSGNQFGMDQETIEAMIREREDCRELRILGLQFYSGTQKKKLSKIRKELDRLDAFLQELKDRYDFLPEELEYGPGFYVPYFLDEEPEDMEGVLGEFGTMLDALQYRGHITLEMGRYLAGSCGRYYTRVADEKTNKGELYGIADGGIHQLNYYGQMMAMKIPHYRQLDPAGRTLVKDGKAFGETAEQAENIKQVTLCGSLCTVNDILVRSIGLVPPVKGTEIVFDSCGAYSVTEGMALFLSRDLPRVYLLKEGSYRLVRERIESNQVNGAACEG